MKLKPQDPLFKPRLTVLFYGIAIYILFLQIRLGWTVLDISFN